MTIRAVQLAVVALFAGWSVASAHPQQEDSTAAARAAYHKAFAAYQKGDYSAARDGMREARASWPTQEAYVYGLAATSARVGDTVEAVRWLHTLATMGLTHSGLVEDPDFAPIRGAPAFTAVVAELAQSGAAMRRSRVRFTLDPADLFPEGISADPGTGRWFLASVRHRKIVALDRTGVPTDFVKPSPQYFSFMGVRADPAHGLLWATMTALPQGLGYQPADSGRAGVVGFDLATGELRHRFVIPDREPHVLGDLVVDSHGVVYASDSRSPVIYRVRQADGRPALQEFVRHPLFRSLQGLALDSTETTLYVADYVHGIVAVDLTTRAVRLLPAPATATVLGVDGLVRSGNSLIGIQNGVTTPRVIRMALDSSGRRIRTVTQIDRHLPLAEEPTIGTLLGDRFYYVANSPWEYFDDDGVPKPNVKPPRPVVLELPVGTRQ